MAEAETKEAVRATIFEPHGGYPEFAGEPMPFGYLSYAEGPTGAPSPIFALDPVERLPVEELARYARLIAASPDLLAFAKALDASWLETFPEGPDADYSNSILNIADEHKALWRQCRAAISRAEA